MKIKIDKNRCPQNHKCPSVNVCPTGAIIQKGYACPTIDEKACIKCGKCIMFCPMRVFSEVG